MKAKYQSVHFNADQKLIDFIESKLEKLKKIYTEIVDINVILKLENSGQVKDKITEIIVFIPGNKLIGKSISKSFEQSTDESIDALTRQLKKIKGKRIDRNRVAKSA